MEREVGTDIGCLTKGRGPGAPRIAELVRVALRVERIRLEPGIGAGDASTLARRPQRHASWTRTVAYHVQLIVDDEEIGGRCIFGGCGRFNQFDRAGIEEAAEHLIHRQEGSRHTAGTGEEAPPRHAKTLGRRIGERADARLDFTLRRRLRKRHILPIRDVLGWHRRVQRIGFVGPCELRQLFIRKPGIGLALIALFAHAFLQGLLLRSCRNYSAAVTNLSIPLI